MSVEIFIHDVDFEIIVPYGISECKEENIDDIINSRQKTQIYYDELLHCYLTATLPPESNLEDKEEATEFFKKLDITFEAKLIDTYLSVPPNYSPQLHRTLSSSSTSSSISGIFSSDTSIRSRSSSISTSSTIPGSPFSGYSIKRSSSNRLTEGSVIHSTQFNSKNKKNDEMVVVKRDDCWVCVLPLSFPVEYIKTRAQNQIALNVKVTQSRRKMVKSSDSDLYAMENFGVNLLAGLNDDPAFESLNTSCSIPVKQDLTKKASIYSTLPSTPIKKCVRKVLSVRPTLNVRTMITELPLSEGTKMMSVELENDSENDITFSVEAVKVEIAHAFVTRYGWSQDTSNDESPILLRPMEQMTFLYNVTLLEDPSFPNPSNAQQHYPTPSPNSRASSRRESVASINPILNALPVENGHRPLSIIVSACPVIDGVKSRCVESRWNSVLDVPTLSMDDLMNVESYQLEEVESRHASMTYDDKFETASRDSVSLYSGFSNCKSLHSIGCGNNSSGAGLEINVDTDTFNKKDYSGCPDINLLDDNGESNGILPSGRSPKLPKQEDLGICDDIAVSFKVCDKPVVGKVFSVKVSMLNKSKHARKFTIMIPNKKLPDDRLIRPLLPRTLLTDITLVDDEDKDIIQPLEDPLMGETEFLRTHLESELLNAGLICLDKSVKVGPIDPYKSETVTLHFISTKEALQMVESVQLVDDDTGFMTNLSNVAQINIGKSYAKYERRIDRNPVILRHIEVTG